MGFKDCLNTLRAAGDIDETDFADLLRRYDDLTESSRGTTDPRGPEGVAKAALSEQLKRDAAQLERQAALQAEKIQTVGDYLKGYSDPKGQADILQANMGLLDNRNNVLAGAPSVTGRRDALGGYAHGRLEAMLYETRRSFGLGVRRGAARLEGMVDAAFNEKADAVSRDFMKSYWNLTDELVDRFNAAGGDIQKLANYLPQSHDARALAAAKPEAWKAFIRDRLDITQMRDPLTGGPLVATRLDEALDVIYRRIITDGAIDRAPSGQPFGRGKLANQRQEHRFLVFKDATAWREYHASFGGNDIYGALMGHVDGLVKDIASMEVLGPNPASTVEWMKQVQAQEAAKAVLGETSLFKGVPSGTRGGDIDDRTGAVQRLWDVVNGSTGVGNMVAADGFQAARNYLTAVNLSGAAVTAFVGDPMQQANAKRFAGIPQLRALADLPRQMFSGASKRDIVRAGVVFADAHERLRTDVKNLSLMAASNEMSRWLPDRLFQWTLLTPWTNANKRSQAMSFMFEAADRLSQSMPEIAADGTRGERFARWMQGFGVNEAEWETIRAAKPLDHGEAGGLLRMMDIVDSAPGDKQVFDTALRYSEAVHAFMEEAVPQGTARVRAAVGRGSAAGTLEGEVVRSAMMYLSYPLNVWWSLARGMSHELAEGNLRGAGYLSAAVVSLTVGGVMIEQIKSLMRGEDTRALDDPGLWGTGLARGGALGFWGDYLLSDYKRGGGEAAARAAGPLAGAAFDAIAVANPSAAMADEDANRGRAAVRFGKRYVPFQNMWWLRPVTERLIWDRLQMIADPHAHRSWQRQERKLMEEKGQGVWWHHGEAVPLRAPDLTPFSDSFLR